MSRATLTSKGQITLPKEVRDAMGVVRGDSLEFLPAEGGYLVRPSGRSVRRLAGFFGPHRGEPVSIEQMNQDIAAAPDAVRGAGGIGQVDVGEQPG
jgi:AbrB family looped-hinge helix DNA binding protein